MPTPQAVASSLRAGKVAELAAEAKRLAAAKEHYVSHLSSNLGSLSGGFEPRDQGVSFARAPHERMSSPTISEPVGNRGVVFAKVTGNGLDYARPNDSRVLDALLYETIDAGGTSDDALAALREAGVQWVNNWNSIGESPELYSLDPAAIEIRKVVPTTRRYSFPPPGAERGISTDGDWRSAATLGAGQPEIRGSAR